jgi:lipopolysaccharide/colanic/teichoic acid biosynthesis glycosyltransferase
MKRFFDLVVASGALLLLSPLLLVLAMLVKLGDGGAVLYRGPRVGLGGDRFACANSGRCWNGPMRSAVPRRLPTIHA